MLNKIIYWTGWFAVLAGVLLSAAEVTFTFFTSEGLLGRTPGDILSSIFFFSGAVMLVPGMVGIYLRQAEQAGKFGLIAFLIALIGSALMVASDWDELFAMPILMAQGFTQAPDGMIIGFLLNFSFYGIGWILFAIASYRANVYHRLPVLMLPFGHLLALTDLPGTYIFSYVAVLLMGLEIVRQKEQAQMVPATATALG